MDYGLHLDPGETITRVVRRHILDVVPTLLVSVVLAVAAVFLAYIMGRSPELAPFPPDLMAVLIATMTIIAAIIFVAAIFVYRGNVLIFTNTHLIQIERLAVFQRRVSQLSFLMVEDVTGRRVGLLQVLFNYGNVEVQSAAEREKFIFKNAPRPELIADEALQIHEECLLRKDMGSLPTP